MRSAFWVVVGLCAVAGCVDESAQQQIEAARQFNQALELVRQADRGFVEGEVDGSNEDGSPEEPSATNNRLSHPIGGADLWNYRQGLLSQAASVLEQAAGQGNDAQQVAVKRLLADVYTSQVNHTMQQAMSQWTELSNRCTTLFEYKSAIGQSRVQVQLLRSDQSPLLTQSQETQVQSRRRVNQLHEDIRLLTGRIDNLLTRMSDLKDQANRSMAQAQELRNQALTATGASQYDLYDEASQSERRADQLSAEAQEAQIKQDLYSSELAVLKQQLELTEELLSQSQQQISLAQDQQHRTQQQIDQSRRNVSDHVRSLNQSFEQLSQAFAQSVDQPLDGAGEKAAKAVDLLQAAVQSPHGDDARAMQLELLSQIELKIHVLFRHVLVLSSHGHWVSVMAHKAKNIGIDSADALTDDAKQTQAKQFKLIDEITALMQEASASAERLAKGVSETDPMIASIAETGRRLEYYKLQIDQLLLEEQAVPERSAPTEWEGRSTGQGTSDESSARPAPSRRRTPLIPMK